MEIIILLPNQLFKNNPLITSNSKVYLLEHKTYFTSHKFHKLKLIFHRSTMKQHKSHLQRKYKIPITYLNFTTNPESIFSKHHSKTFKIYDPLDANILSNFLHLSKKYNINLQISDNPLFLLTKQEVTSYSETRNTFQHDTFYKHNRLKFQILMKHNKPLGNTWSFDSKNRKPFPKNIKEPLKLKTQTNKYIQEAKTYISKHFKNNPGDTNLYLPINHQSSKKHFHNFLKKKFKHFGEFQDAVHSNITFGYHSVISPLLNVGLLTPKHVIQKSQEYGIKHKIPLESIEGYIRQILGWREYVRMLYETKNKELSNLNFFNHHRKLPQTWFTGSDTTGIPFIDDLIQKTLKYSYLHHIERLMYVGNFMLITKTDPKEVLRWFISLCSLDAYEWVMVPNIYGMSQFSSGDLMMKRPYLCSSNYVVKMSDYKRNVGDMLVLGGSTYYWNEVFDALYYNFINENKGWLRRNYAVAAQVGHWEGKTSGEKREMLKIARLYLDNY